MKIFFRIIIMLIVSITLIIYFSLYFITPGFIVKSNMQNFLDKEFNKKFKIISVDKNYSPDLFHQVTGYKLELEDSEGIRIHNIYLQKSSTTNEWIPYQGTDVEAEYLKSKSKN